MISVYQARETGRQFCLTEGSDHYKGKIEPIDYMISNGIFENFAIGNIIKYATRFKKTRNLDDLKKVADYAHILSGLEILQKGESK